MVTTTEAKGSDVLLSRDTSCWIATTPGTDYPALSGNVLGEKGAALHARANCTAASGIGEKE